MAPDVTGPEPEPISVLVVDDELAVVRALERILRQEGYRVVSTTDPAEAPRLVESERVDVVLSDVDMPQLDGLALAAWLRRDHPDIVRLLLSGRASLPAAIRAINEGEVFRFLTKPWDPDDLRAVLREAAERVRRARAEPNPQLLADRRRRLLDELEGEHPGITSIVKSQGVYKIDPARVAETVRRLDAPALAALWAPE